MNTFQSMKDRLGIHSIGEISLMVPDLYEAEHFYRAFGLQVVSGAQGLTVSTADGWCWLKIVQGEVKRLRHISFHCFEADWGALQARVYAMGLKLESAPSWAETKQSVWLRDPDGVLLQIRVGGKTTLDEACRTPLPSPEDGLRASPNRLHRPHVAPTRLSHVMLFTPDVQRAIDFYEAVLGLRLSDRSGELVAFLHGPHGSDHHLMAFGLSHGPGLHHLSWDVPTVEEVGVGAAQMAAQGYVKGWGLGRHVLGSNYFHYVADPWGSYCEYSACMDFIPGHLEWQAGDHPPEDSSYLWGPEMPSFMLENLETPSP